MSSNPEKIINYLSELTKDENVIMSLSVKNAGHWVAVEYIEDGIIYIRDPGGRNGLEVVPITDYYSMEGVTEIDVWRYST